MPKEIDENKAIQAADIVKDPEVIHGFLNQYILLRETSILGHFSNTLQAMNLLGDFGWEVVTQYQDAGGNLCTLMRNTQYKRKNQ